MQQAQHLTHSDTGEPVDDSDRVDAPGHNISERL